MLEDSSASSYAPISKSKSPNAPLMIVTSAKRAESPSRRPSDAESTISPGSTISPASTIQGSQGCGPATSDGNQQQQWYTQQHAHQQQPGYGY
ncbi:hypothetical protein BC830DRAFT_1171108 [Chytriomyces sp. MP71]|nr:hypothetical protein BC830DRAFT_1171108 [Chytriomyces sp. MP71]